MDKILHILLTQIENKTLPNSYDEVMTALETLVEKNLNLAFVKHVFWITRLKLVTK